MQTQKNKQISSLKQAKKVSVVQKRAIFDGWIIGDKNIQIQIMKTKKANNKLATGQDP